ncbi:beta-lactamase family protein [Pochonia chlamydosporia 170]|uniref:Beta-lactamase family protein n=1 Tax=Pochonia chlamydosporia 170 TaxID=1380566 RepID=A0A179F4M0_METCM|nr:beta-lactamase family protein [Pochonia chlamydosporia 170]OAQ60378.1 beta-lactamase family protein [Pochonia chlamydosporia 170]
MANSLSEIEPVVKEMCRNAGVPGLAIGVIHDGKVAYESYIGHRDLESNLPVDCNTLFYVASLTKAMTATCLGILVHQRKLEWTTPVHEILPDMSKSTEIFEAKLTVLDILSHRTGKAWSDALYLESNNRILLPKHESIPIFDYLPQVEPVRSRFMYNNYAYNIAGLVIEKLSGVSWGQFIKDNLFIPLNMRRSFVCHPDDDNIAAPYNILTNRSAHRLPFCNASDETMMFAGQSVRTCMSDLLKYCTTYLDAFGAMIPIVRQNSTSTHDNLLSRASKLLVSLANSAKRPSEYQVQKYEQEESHGGAAASPIKEIATIARPHISRPVANSILEQTYALGWNRTQLPGALDFGWNQDMLQSFPLLGEGYAGKLAIWHGGNMPGTTSAILLIPETKSGVIVLQNSLGLCDVTDWTSQLVMDMLMLGHPAHDYATLAAQCVEGGIQRMIKVEEKLSSEQITGTKSRPLDAYTGRYMNCINNWYIDIKDIQGQLYLEFLGREDERYQLRHYHHDTFVWNLSYDEIVKRGQYVRSYEYYRLEFEIWGDNDKFSQLRWRHDKSVPQGEMFSRGIKSP